MKATVAGLQVLRRFREGRAERDLAAQRRALEQACQTLARVEEGMRNAQARVDAADAALQQALLGGRLSSGHYLHACEEIQALREAVMLEAGARASALSAVAACRQDRDLAQQLFVQRQRQLEALQPWLAHEARRERMARDSYEESLTEERRPRGGVR